MTDLTPGTPPSSTDTATQVYPPGGRRPFNEISVLFPLLMLYTTAYLALMITDFLLKGAFELPEGMLPAYIALLAAYAADKEVRRWIGAAEPPRRGSVFVYFWMTFYMFAYIISSYRPEYVLPNNLLAVCLQVLGIFFGSKISKYLHGTRGSAEEYESARATRQARHGGQAEILEMLKRAGKVTNREVAARLQVSARSASRLLTELTAQGRVRQMGKRKNTYYILP